MSKIRNQMLFPELAAGFFLLFNCASSEIEIQPQKASEALHLEFAGNRIELRNPMPRNGEEVEVTVMVQNQGNQIAKRIPVFFYDNLRAFSTDEIDLEPAGQKRLSARWRATSGNHLISVIIDPSHYFKEMSRQRTDVSTSVLVN